MTDKNEPKTYIIDKFKKSYSSIQKMVAEESRNFAQYAVIIDRLLAEFETYDKIKSLDIKEYAIKIFSELDQLKAEKINIENDLAVEIQARLFHTHKHLEYLELSNKYKQALQDIKKITVTLKADICSYCDSKDTDRCEQTDIDELEQILQKCEVIYD